MRTIKKKLLTVRLAVLILNFEKFAYELAYEPRRQVIFQYACSPHGSWTKRRESKRSEWLKNKTQNAR